MNKPIKINAEHIYESLSASLPMSNIYLEFNSFINALLDKIYMFNFSNDIRNDIDRFLTLTISKDEVNNNLFVDGSVENIGYTILLSVMGISREKMKNVIIPFYQAFSIIGKPTIKKILSNRDLKNELINILIDGDTNLELNSILNGDYTTLSRFSLHEYNSLRELFESRKIVKRELEDTYCSRVQNKKGYSTETNILASIVHELNLKYEAGEVPCLEAYFPRTSTEGDSRSRNPRIDLVIPSLANPKILIESTYNLTTASGQTKKVDANDSLYRAIKAYNNATGDEIIFINFVDGGGWKSRGISDVSRLVSSCDYAVNYNNLDLLKEVLKYYFNIA